MKKDTKLGLLSVITFILIQYFGVVPLLLLNIDVESFTDFQTILFMLTLNIIMTISLLVIFKEKLKNDFKDLLKNHKKYFKENLKYYFIGLGVMFISNIIILAFHNTGPANEEAIRELVELSPIYIFFASVIVAPITEELVFRQGFRNLIKNDFLFVILSGVVFGALHVLGTVTSTIDLLYIIPYSSLGIAFAYMLVKTKNIYVPMSLHFMHNGILMSLQILLLFL